MRFLPKLCSPNIKDLALGGNVEVLLAALTPKRAEKFRATPESAPLARTLRTDVIANQKPLILKCLGLLLQSGACDPNHRDQNEDLLGMNPHWEVLIGRYIDELAVKKSGKTESVDDFREPKSWIRFLILHGAKPEGLERYEGDAFEHVRTFVADCKAQLATLQAPAKDTIVDTDEDPAAKADAWRKIAELEDSVPFKNYYLFQEEICLRQVQSDKATNRGTDASNASAGLLSTPRA